jgi:8-hydroxy-5-deazaflavin:NADPH oxidoreductase
MKIGIIGAGNIGSILARKLTRLGHEVAVANSRGPETLSSLSNETGARASTIKGAVRGSEIVIITIPQGCIGSLPKNLFAEPGERIILDTGNYYPNGNPDYGRETDGFIAEIEAGMPESRWVETQLGHTIFADDLAERGKPKGDPARVALPIAGDDSHSKQVVTQLLGELGFDPVDAGNLDESWRQQPATPQYIKNLNAEQLARV